MLANFSKNIIFNSKSLSQLLTQNRYASLFSSDYVEPIVDKHTLDNLTADDPIHFKKILPAKGNKSPALSYNPIVDKFINVLMRGGGHHVARKIIEDTFYTIKLRQLEKWHKAVPEKRKDIETNPVKIFLTALENCKPVVKVTPVLKGGITYQVPVPISENERRFRAMKFLHESCLDKERQKIRIYIKLADELLAASENRGTAYNKKIELHKVAEANRAYAHYRWSE